MSDNDVKRREKEKNSGGAAPWTVGARGGSEFLSGSQGAFSRLLAGRGASGGILDGLANFLSTKLGMMLMTAAVAGVSTYSLYSLYGPQELKPARQAMHFPKTEYSEKAIHNLPMEGQAPSSLEELAAANRPAADQGAAIPGAGAAAQAAGSAGGAQPQASADNGSGSAPADQNTGQARQAMLQKVAGLGGSGESRAPGAAAGVGAPSVSGKSLEGDLASARLSHGTLEGMSSGGARTASLGSSRALVGSRGSKSALASLNQLGTSARFSNAGAAAGASEEKSYLADKAFSGGPVAGGGLPLLGAGDGSGGAGTGISPDQGGPIQQPSANPRQAPPVRSGADVSPWTSMVMMATSMLMIASLIIFMMGLISLMKKQSTSLFLWGALQAWQQMLYGLAIGMAMIAAGLGIMLATMYGQTAQGSILATGGAITASAAAVAMWFTTSGPLAAWLGVLGGIAGMAASVGSMLRH